MKSRECESVKESVCERERELSWVELRWGSWSEVVEVRQLRWDGVGEEVGVRGGSWGDVS